jgi:hypothetical protein
MNDYYNKLKQEIINYLENEPLSLDEPYIFNGTKKWTKRELINEITNNTEIGIDFVNQLIILSLDLLNRKKELINNFEKI